VLSHDLKSALRGIGMYAFGVGCGSTDNDSEVNLREWMWSLGGGIFDEQGNPDTNKEGNIHVWTRYKELWDAGCIPEGALSWDGTGNNTSYLTSEIALMYNNVSYFNALSAKGNEAVLADTGIVQNPEGPKYGSPGGYGILKDTKNPELAKQLLLYLYDPEWYDDFMISTLPTMGPVFAETIEKNPDKFTGLAAMVDKRGVDTSPFGYPAGFTVKGLANGSKVFGSYAFNLNLQKVLVDNVPVEEALANLQSDMESLCS
jgi:ABC-type glycerol-3-phosphate transport system substrate-binding protein